jgi:hypothetical protein
MESTSFTSLSVAIAGFTRKVSIMLVRLVFENKKDQLFMCPHRKNYPPRYAR